VIIKYTDVGSGKEVVASVDSIEVEMVETVETVGSFISVSDGVFLKPGKKHLIRDEFFRQAYIDINKQSAEKEILIEAGPGD